MQRVVSYVILHSVGAKGRKGGPETSRKAYYVYVCGGGAAWGLGCEFLCADANTYISM